MKKKILKSPARVKSVDALSALTDCFKASAEKEEEVFIGGMRKRRKSSSVNANSKGKKWSKCFTSKSVWTIKGK